MNYEVLQLSELLPENAQVGDVLEITDYSEACMLVERSIVKSLNEHVRS